MQSLQATLGRRKPWLKHLLFGSVTEEVVRPLAHCPGHGRESSGRHGGTSRSFTPPARLESTTRAEDGSCRTETISMHVYQHDPHVVDGRRAGSQLGAPRRADGPGPVAYCLWQRFLRFDPQDPIWPNRDRFILSNGHASMLLYSLLHLTGVKAVSKDYETLGEPSVPLEAIERFRQMGSQCRAALCQFARRRAAALTSGSRWVT